MINCYACNTEMIWGGDHDVDDNEEFSVVSNFTCPKCNSYAEFFHYVCVTPKVLSKDS